MRQRAELVASPLPPLAFDVLRQQHELEVTQIELDMQTAALVEIQQQYGETRNELMRYQRQHWPSTQSKPLTPPTLAPSVLAHVASTHDQQRRAVAQEIHDDLGQNLLALRIDVAMLRNRTASHHPRLHEHAGRVLGQVDNTLHMARGIINNLYPPVLSLGLAATLEWQVRQFSQQTAIACRLSAPDDAACAHVAAAHGIALYRMLQEMLANVRRHAHADMVDVGLRLTGDWLELTVADNGVGITRERRDAAGCFGLRVIAERLAAVGGELRIESDPPGRAGTSLVLRMPVAAALD